jgi:hypothetical protein
MADSFADQLRTELDGIQADLDRLDARRRLVEELLSLESGGLAPSKAGKRRTRPAASAPAQPARRRRLPRGLLSGKIREFLGQQTEPVHATKILAFLEQHDAAPRSAKPMANLQSALQRLKETGELENTGRNHWRLRSASAAGAPTRPPTPGATPPVVTSTTRFGSTPLADRPLRT